MMKQPLWAVCLLIGLLTVAACAPVAMPATESATAEPMATEAAASEAMTDTMPMTDTEMMTDTMPMTGTDMMTDTDMMTETDMMTDTAAMGTIVDIAVANPDFSTLVTAVTEAGLVDVLADPNAQWTVFAPTNEAFAALPAGVLDMVLADKELLTRILTYHVVEGVVTSDMVSTMMAPTMEMGSVGGELLGGQLDVQVTDSGVMVNGANVVAVDIMASNGVIHVVDAVLLPPDVAEMVGQ